MKDGKIIGEGITFDDVLLLPARSSVIPADVDTSTKLTRTIRLNVPIVSSAMDTVTEGRLAIALAQDGGIGIIHRNLSIEEQCREVTKVKRSENGVILNPICLPPDAKIGTARQIMNEHNISGIPIIGGNDKLVGILTMRDMRFQKGEDRKVSEIMTKDNLVTAPMGTTLDQAKSILDENKVEKLLLVDAQRRLKGLITMKDINKTIQYPKASKDGRGRLRVGAAVGVFDYERAEALVKSDVDVVVIDTAHGHSDNVIKTIREVKRKFKIDVIAGNIATVDAARELVAAGADGLKVGIGPGSICTTRIIAGIGVPQVTAIFNCASVASKKGVPVIADGGIRHSGDITKAVAAGAHSVMLGGLFAGVAESPGDTVLYKGRSYKVYRGMGSIGAMVKGKAARERYGQAGIEERQKLVPEGVEGRVPFRGPVSDFIYQLVGGLRAGMGYCGARTIEDLHSKSQFIRVSVASLRESHPHDIIITSEAPNYWLEREEA
jgi:IMP dehydrogenase